MRKTLTVPEQHQRRIAFDTLKLNDIGASIMGGMNHKQAVQTLRACGHTDRDIVSRLEKAGHDAEAIIRYTSM